MRGAGVTADDLGMDGPRGTVFRGVNFTAEPGELVAIEGPSGSGRTCLLLALTGRMRTTAGQAEVGGLPLPKKMAAVRGITALGPVSDVNDLDAALTVTEHLRERSLLRPYFSGRRLERSAERRARIDRALDLAGLDLDALPKGPRTTARNLERLEELRLGTALALLDEPRLIAVDDVGLKLSDAERQEMWALLRTVADSGVTVLAACSQASEDAAVVRIGAEPEDGTAEPETAEDETAEDGTAEPETAEDETAEDEARDATGAQDADGPAGQHDDDTTTSKEGPGDALAEAGRA